MRYGAFFLVMALGCGPEAPPKQQTAPPKPKSPPAPQPTPVVNPTPPTPPPDPGTDTLQLILAKAGESLERAKMLYREGSEGGSTRALEEAGFAAEDARNKYQVLAEALDGDGRAAARDKLVQTNQLIKLINDSRKSAQAPPTVAPPSPPPESAPPIVTPEPPREPVPPPPPPAEPAKPAEPLPAPSTPHFLALFKEYIGSPDSAKIRPARDAALDAIATEPDLTPFSQAVATILGRPDRLLTFVRSPERVSFVDILAKHDPTTRKLDEIQTALTEIAAARSDTGLLRLWGMAYLARAATLGTPDPDIMKWLPRLGLISKLSGGARSIGTREGLEMRALDESAAKGTLDRDIKSARLIKDEDFQAHVALLQLRAWDLERDVDKKKAQVGELEKHFRTLKIPPTFVDLFRHVADTLRRRAPCVPCGASGKVDCPQCEDGRVVGRCPDCNGTGQDRNRRRGVFKCDRCEGSGQVARDRCRDCRGQGTTNCATCDGKPWTPPALAEFVGQGACSVCSERGFIAAPLWVPCEECLGFGKRPFKP